MNPKANYPEASSEAVYPIRTVSTLTGVNAITLRAWESRYGIIEPIRTDSGHRVYTQSDVDLIHRIVGMLDRGIRIGQVRSELENENLISTGAKHREIDVWQQQVNHMLVAVIRFDEEALDHTYSEMLSLYPVHKVTEFLIIPLLNELGRRWANKKGSVAEEHFFGFYLRSKLGARLHHRARSTSGPRLLMACMPGDHHEIGLLMLAIEANDRHFQLVMLGADMPLEEIPEVVNKASCDAILLSSTVVADSGLFKDQLAALVSMSSVPVFVGGMGAQRAANEVKRAGAINCGVDAGVGLKKIQKELGFDSGREVSGWNNNGENK